MRGQYPGAARRNGQNPPPVSRGRADRRVRAAVSPRRPAAVRRGLLGLDRRLQPRGAAARPRLPRRDARRRPARLDLVAERARGRSAGWRSCSSAIALINLLAGPAGARDPEPARQDRARRASSLLPGAAAADLRRPVGSAAVTVAANLAAAGPDLRGLRLRPAGDPALGARPARRPARAPRSACSPRRCRCSRSSPCSRSRARRCGRSSRPSATSPTS